jgi:hypothetical protein
LGSSTNPTLSLGSLDAEAAWPGVVQLAVGDGAPAADGDGAGGLLGGTGILAHVLNAGVGTLGAGAEAAGGLLADDVLNAGIGSFFNPYVSGSGAGVPVPASGSPKAGIGGALAPPAGSAGTVKFALHSGHFIIWPAY